MSTVTPRPESERPSDAARRVHPLFRALAVASATVAPVAVLFGAADAIVLALVHRSYSAAGVAVLVAAGAWPVLVPLVLITTAVRRGPKLLAPHAGLTVFGVAGALLGMRIAETVSTGLFQTLRRPDLAGLVLTLGALGCVIIPTTIGAVLGAAAERRWQLPSKLDPAQRGKLAWWTLVALVLAWGAWRITSLDLWIHLPAAELSLAIGASVLLGIQSKFERLGRWARGNTNATLALLLVVSIAGWSFAAVAYPSKQGARLALNERSITARWLLGTARALTDRDGDGWSPLYGGGDCDDGNAAVNPDAVDRPGDGVDQDCMAGDSLPDVFADPNGRSRYPVRLGPSEPRPTFRSAVVIILDAVRFDVTGAGTSGVSDTPFLDELGRQGVVFTRAWAPAPGTWPSVPAYLTGRYPLFLKWDRDTKPPGLHADNVTLAEALRSHEVRTMALVSLYMAHTLPGLSQGFEVVATPLAVGATPEQQHDTTVSTLDHAKRLIEAHGLDRTFLYVHFMDAHEPYLRRPGVEGDDDFSIYRGEVRWVDRHVRELVSFLRGQPGADETVIVVTADHGEAFGEHGEKFHARQLYEESVRVPLVISGRGVHPAVRSEPVSLVDLAPTLLDVLGIPAVGGMVLDGRSLAPDLRGAPPPEAEGRAVYTELAPWQPSAQTAVISGGRWKLILRRKPRLLELFDLQSDPAERVNVVDELERERATLGALLSSRWSAYEAAR